MPRFPSIEARALKVAERAARRSEWVRVLKRRTLADAWGGMDRATRLAFLGSRRAVRLLIVEQTFDASWDFTTQRRPFRGDLAAWPA